MPQYLASRKRFVDLLSVRVDDRPAFAVESVRVAGEWVHLAAHRGDAGRIEGRHLS